MNKKRTTQKNKKRTFRKSKLVTVSLDSESYMLWRKLPIGNRSILVQEAVKLKCNTKLTPEEAQERIIERITQIKRERDIEQDQINEFYNAKIMVEQKKLQVVNEIVPRREIEEVLNYEKVKDE